MRTMNGDTTNVVIMKNWILILILGYVSVGAYEKQTVTECLWHNNTCVDVCPEGMVINKNDCKETYWEAQKTCEHPEQMLVGTVCGFSRCDCPEPTVLDTETGYCYDVDNCPTKHELTV